MVVTIKWYSGGVVKRIDAYVSILQGVATFPYASCVQPGKTHRDMKKYVKGMLTRCHGSWQGMIAIKLICPMHASQYLFAKIRAEVDSLKIDTLWYSVHRIWFSMISFTISLSIPFNYEYRNCKSDRTHRCYCNRLKLHLHALPVQLRCTGILSENSMNFQLNGV